MLETYEKRSLCGRCDGSESEECTGEHCELRFSSWEKNVWVERVEGALKSDEGSVESVGKDKGDGEKLER